VATGRKNFARLQVVMFKSSSTTQTEKDMVLGKLSSLERFKSLQDKESLLDSALEWGVGRCWPRQQLAHLILGMS
jgi:hypothetical protein